MSGSTLSQDEASLRAGRGRVVAPPRWRDLVAAEWLKFRSLRSTFVVLAVAVGLAFFFAFAAAKQTVVGYPGAGDWMVGQLQPGHDAFFPPGFYAVMAVVGTIGAQSVVAEHASGLIRTTYIAVPVRSRVMLAKAVVAVGVFTGIGVIVVAGCWQIMLTEYSSTITAYSWHTPGLAGVFAATVLLFPLCGLIGMAVGTVIRHTAVNIFAMVIAFWVMPVGISSLDGIFGGTRIFLHVSNVMPENGWLFLTTLGNAGHIVGGHPSATEAWICYPAWAVASVLIIAFASRWRDV